MPQTMTGAVRSQEVRTQDSPRPQAAKASLRGSDAVRESPMMSDFGPGRTIWEVLVKGHGSANATAITMGNTDPSLLRRQVTEGTIQLRKFFEADEAALCEFAEYVLETFQPARKSKKQIARERLPELLTLMLDAVTEDE